MSCPTCDHTMHGLGEQWFWCPRCGTILNSFDREHTVSMPKAVEQMRNYLHNPTHISESFLGGVMRGLIQHPEERKGEQ